LININLKYYSI